MYERPLVLDDLITNFKFLFYFYTFICILKQHGCMSVK